MSVIDYFRRGAAASAPQTKASAAGPVISYHSAGRVVWSPRDVASLTRTGFAGNPVVHRAVKLIAEAGAALPLILQDATSRYDSHPLIDLMARPNGSQGRAELFEALYGQLVLTGNAYLEGSRPRMARRSNCTSCALTGCRWCRARMAGPWPMTMPWAGASTGSTPQARAPRCCI